MKYRGIVYDVGLDFNNDGKLSVEPFNPALAEHDIRVIATELHANAIRIEGEEIQRLVTATRYAHSQGLSVFFNPWKMHADRDETCVYMREAAQAAEQLRNEGIDVVFVAGCEYTMFNKGIFPGDTLNERMMYLASQFSSDPNETHYPSRSFQEKSMELNEVLRLFVEAIRTEFKGLVTYSAGPWELVDWNIFDIVGVDYYRHGESEAQYLAGLDRYRVGKTLAVMEFGCCTYDGAGPHGAGGFMLLQGMNPDGTAIFHNDIVPTRNEREQADYIDTQLGLLEKGGVDAAFVYVFSFPTHTAGEGAKDLDMMSFSLVKTWPESDERGRKMPPWEAKEAFYRVAECFEKLAAKS
ncbi:hypothetical protein IQ07DRAFT_681961 [Pyrenochaeta sp. DS3sAY3a]|nr:hypothetical protein IQ07DRAFT_681961 [Pyrenochaeta sp. DS3sAY3a]